MQSYLSNPITFSQSPRLNQSPSDLAIILRHIAAFSNVTTILKELVDERVSRKTRSWQFLKVGVNVRLCAC